MRARFHRNLSSDDSCGNYKDQIHSVGHDGFKMDRYFSCCCKVYYSINHYKILNKFRYLIEIYHLAENCSLLQQDQEIS